VARSQRHELVVGAFGDLAPAAELFLELRERGRDLLRHRALLGLLLDDLGRELLESRSTAVGKRVGDMKAILGLPCPIPPTPSIPSYARTKGESRGKRTAAMSGCKLSLGAWPRPEQR
jgi:hypothetical protein